MGRHKTGPCMRPTWLESNYQFVSKPFIVFETMFFLFGRVFKYAAYSLKKSSRLVVTFWSCRLLSALVTFIVTSFVSVAKVSYPAFGVNV